MHHHVWIPTDWRREVGVVGEGKPVMADVVGGVACPGHNSDGELAQHVVVGFPFLAFQHLVQRTTERLGGFGVQLNTQLFDEVFECGQFLVNRLVMDTVNESVGRFAI